MRYTNKFSLPDGLARAVMNDPYSKGDADFSVTELLDPPQMGALKAKHANEITEDVSERIWSLLGQVTHGIIERAETEAIAERRLTMTILGKTISGGMDRFCNKEGLLSDYKLTTAWKFKDGKLPEDMEIQQNVYVHLLRVNGIEVKRSEIIGILRDWSKLEARRSAGYPQSQVLRVPVPIWQEAKIIAYLEGRVKLHSEAREGKFEPCTPSERWARPDVYAVMKEGRKTAVRLHDDETSATRHALELGANHSVVKRPGESVRCSAYCAVAQFCPTYKKMNGGGE